PAVGATVLHSQFSVGPLYRGDLEWLHAADDDFALHRIADLDLTQIYDGRADRERGLDFDVDRDADPWGGRVAGLEPDVGVPLAHRGVAAEPGRHLVSHFVGLAPDLADLREDVIALGLTPEDLPLAAAEESDVNGCGGGAAALDLAEIDCLRGDVDVVAGV